MHSNRYESLCFGIPEEFLGHFMPPKMLSKAITERDTDMAECELTQ